MPRDTGLLDKTELMMEMRHVNERWFENRWKLIGGPEYQREVRFHKTRRWRFDYCWVNHKPKVALEVDGGGHKMYWSKYRNDVEKTNAAILMGWQVYRITTDMVRSDDVQALENLKTYLLKKMEQEGRD